MIIGGTTGEGLTLANSERKLLVETALRRYEDLIVWGCITPFSVKLGEILYSFEGAKYLLVNPPFFVKPTKHDILYFYRKLIEMCHQKIVIYNNPARTMIDVSEMYAEIFDLDTTRIVGIKETRFDKIPQYPWWCGEDSKLCEYKGKYVGTISVLANLDPELVTNIMNNNHYDEGKLTSLLHKMSLGANPLIIKNLLWKSGVLKTPAMRFPISISTEIVDIL